MRQSKTQHRQVSQACPGEQKERAIVQAPLHWLRTPPHIGDSHLTSTKQQKEIKGLSYPSLQKPVRHFKSQDGAVVAQLSEDTALTEIY